MRFLLVFLFLLPVSPFAQDPCYDENEYETFPGLLVANDPQFPIEYLAGAPHGGSWADTTGLLAPGTTGLLVQVRDLGDPDAPGGPADPNLGCAQLTNSEEVEGHIAFMERGGCEFGLKALHAQEAGAIGFVIRNYRVFSDVIPTYPPYMFGGTYGRIVFIPGLIVSYRAGRDLKEALREGASIEATLRYCNSDAVSAESVLGVDRAELSPAYPNPFTDRSRLDLALSRTQHVKVTVHDVLGRRVAVLHDGVLAAGASHAFTFEARERPAGVYFVRFSGETFMETRRVVLTR